MKSADTPLPSRSDLFARRIFPSWFWLQPALQIDLRWSDFAQCLSCLFKPKCPHEVWPFTKTVTALSVRTSFDQILKVLNFPAGTEIVLGAITIPDIDRIIRLHGLVPRYVDIDPITFEPDLEQLIEAITPNLRIFLATQLFGKVFSLAKYKAVFEHTNIFIIEDCAQAFNGNYVGSEHADISMFSFGPIKKQTALAGAKIIVRYDRIETNLADELSKLTLASNYWFLARILRYFFLKVISTPPLYGCLDRLAMLSGIDLDEVLYNASRGFADKDFLKRIRKRLPPWAEEFLSHRLTRASISTSATCLNAERWVSTQLVDDAKVWVRLARLRGDSATSKLGSLRSLAPSGQCPNAAMLINRLVLTGVK